MLPFPSYYSGFEGSNCSSRDVFLQELGSAETMMDGIGVHATFSSSRSTTEVAKPCKSHKEAERRRRERINGHLSTLRTLLPNTTKTDKASLLAEVVQHMKELKGVAADVAGKLGSNIGGNKEEIEEEEEEEKWWSLFPGEKDEVTLVGYRGETSKIKVSLSCEDREELMWDLREAVKSVRGKVLKAEMATVGGRTKMVLLIQRDEELGCGRHDLGGALKAVIEKKTVVSDSGQVLLGNKRPRLSYQHQLITKNQ